MIAIPPTTTLAHVEEHLAFFVEHLPAALSPAGLAIHQAKLDRQREQEAAHQAGLGNNEARAMQMAFGGKGGPSNEMPHV